MKSEEVDDELEDDGSEVIENNVLDVGYEPDTRATVSRNPTYLCRERKSPVRFNEALKNGT